MRIKLLISIPLILSALQIEFKNLTTEIIPLENIQHLQYYQFQAKRYVQKFSKKDRVLFLLNRKRFMLKHNFYEQGTFSSQSANLWFKKAYVLFKKVHLFEVHGTIYGAKVKAKEIIYDGYKQFILNKCEVHQKRHIYRRKTFILSQ